MQFMIHYFRTEKIEMDNPELISKNSPTQRVGNAMIGGFEKVEHATRMLSLNDVLVIRRFLIGLIELKNLIQKLKRIFSLILKWMGWRVR